MRVASQYTRQIVRGSAAGTVTTAVGGSVVVSGFVVVACSIGEGSGSVGYITSTAGVTVVVVSAIIAIIRVPSASPSPCPCGWLR